MKYRRALDLLSFLMPFIVRYAVEPGTAGGDTKPASDATPAPAPAAAAPAAEAKPKALSASDFMTKLTAAFSAKETLAKENAEQKKRIDALEKERDAATTAKTEAEAAKTSAESAKATAETNLANATTALAHVAAAVGVKVDEIAGKPADQVKQIFNARIETRSSERLAELGFPVSGLPASAETGSTSSTGDELADVQAQLAAEKDPKKAGVLAAKANKLRDAQWAKTGNN